MRERGLGMRDERAHKPLDDAGPAEYQAHALRGTAGDLVRLVLMLDAWGDGSNYLLAFSDGSILARPSSANFRVSNLD